MTGTPNTLYVMSVHRVAQNFDHFASLDLSRHLTESVRFDVYWNLFSVSTSNNNESDQKIRQQLTRELGKLEIFLSLHNVRHRRTELHKMFHACNNPLTSGFPLIENLVSETLQIPGNNTTLQNERRLGPSLLSLACFLIEGGWYLSAETVLRKIEFLPNVVGVVDVVDVVDVVGVVGVVDILQMEVRAKLLHVLSAYSKFSEAKIVFRQILESISPWNNVQCEKELELGSCNRLSSMMTALSTCMLTDNQDSSKSSSVGLEGSPNMTSLSSCMRKDSQGSKTISVTLSSKTASLDGPPNLSPLFSEFSSFYFLRSNYRQAFHWSMEAVKVNHLSVK
jgi:hypothetical protein